MKLTFNLPDDLVIEAKTRAATEQRPLQSLVEQGLRLVLARESENTDALKNFRETMAQLEHINAAGTFSREEMNER